jgi:type III secretion protein C
VIPCTLNPPIRLSRLVRAALALVAAAGIAFAAPASAQELPFPDKTVALSARGQDVRDFIADLMGAAGLTVKVSTAVKGKVQASFRDKPRVIWGTIARAYGLVAYWDGSIVRVYANSEVSSRSLPYPAPADLVGEVTKLKLVDGVNTLRASNGMVLATGVPAFLDRVEGMANQMGGRAASPRAASNTVLASAPADGAGLFASPLLRAPLTRASLRSEVIRPAGRRDPFEVRIFYLTYRDAADREVRSADRLTVIPGVATLLLEQMGDGRQVGGVSSNSANEFEISGLRGVGRQSRPDFDPEPPRGEPGERELQPDGPRISADPTVNAVIVRDSPEKMGVYEQLIASLDIEPLMVETQITIMELNVTRLKELGIDFGAAVPSLGLGALFGGVPTSVAAGSITGGFISGNGDAFLAQIRALEQQGAIRVVTRPVLSTANNQVATFDITAQQVLRLQSERAVYALSLNYGLAMRIRPSAIEDGGEMRIRMQVEVSDTSLNGVVVDGVPTAAGPRIATQMIVRQGESVMLAGMTRTSTYDTKSKTPGLGDIPLLGQAFRKRRKGEDHIERLFLLTPRVSNLGTAQVADRSVMRYPLDQLRGQEAREGQRP